MHFMSPGQARIVQQMREVQLPREGRLTEKAVSSWKAFISL